MKKLLLFLLIISGLSFAQEKLLTVEDVVFKSYSPEFYPRTPMNLSIVPEEDSYSYVKDNSLIISKFESKKEKEVLKLDEINTALKTFNLDELKRFPRFSWQNEEVINFYVKNNFVQFNIDDNKVLNVINFDKDAENQTVAPSNNLVAYTIKNNLYIANKSNPKLAISNEENENIIYGQAVHRNEFGINGGIFWSPKSNYLAFYRMDQTMVTDYPILNVDDRPATVKMIKYPMAGDKSHEVTLGVYNIKTGKTIYLKTGEPKEQYLTCVTWGPEEKYIYIAILNRDQNHMKLTKFDAQTGNLVKVLFEEKSEKYVEPEHQLIFLPENNSKFLWFSERDMWNHLYLYDTEGNLIKQVTKGEWIVKSFEGFDEDGENILISATKDSPIENNYYTVNLETGKIKRITKESGSHYLWADDDFKYFIDTYTSTSEPRKTVVLNKNLKVVKTLQDFDNPLKDYKIGDSKIFTIKGENNIDLYCQMFLPPDFDESKKYPVVVYVYGGPHAQLVTNHWPRGRYDYWFLMMAQKGYIVFQMDNRGSENRGLEFEQATFRQLGTKEIEDQLRGVEYLKSLPYVDANRIGVWGWSYGGFMTTSLMTRTNDTYKVGVAGGAVIDWSHYEIMYTERYMDTPQQNPEGFKNSNLLNHVKNLNGKLLLVHGTSDPVVVWQHTLKFAQKAANLNKFLDYYPYIHHPHGVGGKDALHLYNKITEYFLDNL